MTPQRMREAAHILGELGNGKMANELSNLADRIDKLAPELVRDWAVKAHLNGCPEEKVNEALACANAMEEWPARKYPD